MEITQKNIDMDNYYICNKIYGYLGEHPIILQTNLNNIISDWYNVNYELGNKFHKISFVDFYFDNFDDYYDYLLDSNNSEYYKKNKNKIIEQHKKYYINHKSIILKNKYIV